MVQVIWHCPTMVILSPTKLRPGNGSGEIEIRLEIPSVRWNSIKKDVHFLRKDGILRKMQNGQQDFAMITETDQAGVDGK